MKADNNKRISERARSLRVGCHGIVGFNADSTVSFVVIIFLTSLRNER